MPLQDRLARLLSRGTEPRYVRSLLDPPIILATELGRRTENQDRAAVMRMRSGFRPNRPMIAVAISDGMGGMQDGGACASLTIAALFEALVKFRTLPTSDRIREATVAANERVHEFAKGHGGATLSAVVIEAAEPPWLVNVGDSRIYADLRRSEGNRGLDRLTTDDSLAEAFGGDGRDLLQFMGMGPGIQPHVRVIPTEAQVILLTTDGVHFLDQSLFSEIYLRADTIKQAVDRLSALARWFGAPDNATITAFAPKELLGSSGDFEEGLVEIWTPSESLEVFSLSPGPSVLSPPDSDRQESEISPTAHKPKTRSSRPRRTKTPKNMGQKTKDKSEQLKIEIEVSNGDPARVDRGKI